MFGQFQYNMARPMAYTNPLQGYPMFNFSGLMHNRNQAYGQGSTVINNNYYATSDGFFGRNDFRPEPFFGRDFSRSDNSSRLLVPDFGRDLTPAETISIN